jgi:hypothetical protein
MFGHHWERIVTRDTVVATLLARLTASTVFCNILVHGWPVEMLCHSLECFFRPKWTASGTEWANSNTRC